MTNSIPIGYQTAVTNADGTVSFFNVEIVEWGIDPTGLTFWIIILLIALGISWFFYSARRKKNSK